MKCPHCGYGCIPSGCIACGWEPERCQPDLGPMDDDPDMDEYKPEEGTITHEGSEYEIEFYSNPLTERFGSARVKVWESGASHEGDLCEEDRDGFIGSTAFDSPDPSDDEITEAARAIIDEYDSSEE